MNYIEYFYLSLLLAGRHEDTHEEEDCEVDLEKERSEGPS